MNIQSKIKQYNKTLFNPLLIVPIIIIAIFCFGTVLSAQPSQLAAKQTRAAKASTVENHAPVTAEPQKAAEPLPVTSEVASPAPVPASTQAATSNDSLPVSSPTSTTSLQSATTSTNTHVSATTPVAAPPASPVQLKPTTKSLLEKVLKSYKTKEK